jgi:hypothetical protein
MKLVVFAISLVFGCKERVTAPVVRDDAQRLPVATDAMLPDALVADAAIDPTRAAADDAWREGRLVAAKRSYQELLTRDPNDWRARAAVASMDLAFGKLSVAAARALARDDLSPAAKEHVRVLIEAAENPEHDKLPGSEANWDIEALRVAGKKQRFGWWLKKGEAASQVWLFGLALACFEEACNDFDALRDDPPAWWSATLNQTDDHLKMLANALPR